MSVIFIIMLSVKWINAFVNIIDSFNLCMSWPGDRTNLFIINIDFDT